MREILFKGKRKDNGEWIQGDLLHDRVISSNEKIWRIYNEESKLTHREDVVIPETVGQYTGLTDNYAKRIFEGDIVKADDYIFVVKFGKCGGVANATKYGYMGFYLEALSESTKLSAKYGLRDDICYFSNIEVIGNIHDNRELFEGGAE